MTLYATAGAIVGPRTGKVSPEMTRVCTIVARVRSVARPLVVMAAMFSPQEGKIMLGVRVCALYALNTVGGMMPPWVMII